MAASHLTRRLRCIRQQVLLISKVHKVSGGCQLLSDLNNAYGLNIYGTKAGSVCDFYPVSGNFNDALIDLLTVDAANNLYRIKMINHNLYLTPASIRAVLL